MRQKSDIVEHFGKRRSQEPFALKCGSRHNATFLSRDSGEIRNESLDRRWRGQYDESITVIEASERCKQPVPTAMLR